MDMEAFFCIGYELCKSNFEESGDYEALEKSLKNRYEEGLNTACLVNCDNEPKLFIFFETMFKDGVYLAGNQTHLDSIIRKEKLKVIGCFQPYSVLCGC